MMSKKDAEKAIEGANGATVGGDKYGDPNGKEKERVIAVDWALSKERWEVEKRKIIEEHSVEEDSAEEDSAEEDSVGEGNVGEDSEASSDSESQDDQSEDEDVGVHQDSENESDDAKDDEDEGDDAPDRPQLPPPETGNTLFIRNVPFTATEDELRIL